MSLALLLAAVAHAAPGVVAEMLVLTFLLACAAIRAEGGPGMVASEAASAEVMLSVYGWA